MVFITTNEYMFGYKSTRGTIAIRCYEIK